MQPDRLISCIELEQMHSGLSNQEHETALSILRILRRIASSATLSAHEKRRPEGRLLDELGE
jgi:hypothetical protein